MKTCAETMVVFGATGDLARRKLAPALFQLFYDDRLPEAFRVIGCGTSDLDADAFRTVWQEAIGEFGEVGDHERRDAFLSRLSYLRLDLEKGTEAARLKSEIEAEESAPDGAARLFYLALPPGLFSSAVKLLDAAGLANDMSTLVVEKPFGTDAESATALSAEIHGVFDESQLFRIDHYLGKETAQNILYLRFANAIFEPLWNRDHIQEIQITVAEQVDVADRARYYDRSGVLRDMFQNHLLQLLTLVAMEPPAPMNAKTIHDEKAKVLSALRPVTPEDAVFGQYAGYLEHDGVAGDSRTPTYAAMRLWIDNWRWQGVPFYLQSGKAMETKNSTISIEFRRPPHQMFGQFQTPQPNVLEICIQPDEGIHLSLDAKVPDRSKETARVEVEFHYRDAFPGTPLPDAYERLLLDALLRDSTLFARQDEIELSWGLIDPVIDWLASGDAVVSPYPRGVDIPRTAVDFLARHGQLWRPGCREHD